MKFVKVLVSMATMTVLVGCQNSDPNIDPITAGVEAIAQELYVFPDSQAKTYVNENGLEAEDFGANQDLGNMMMDRMSGFETTLVDYVDEEGYQSVWAQYLNYEMIYVFLTSEASAEPESVEVTKNDDTWYDFVISEAVSWQEEPIEITGSVNVDGAMITNFHVDYSFWEDFISH